MMNPSRRVCMYANVPISCRNRLSSLLRKKLPPRVIGPSLAGVARAFAPVALLRGYLFEVMKHDDALVARIKGACQVMSVKAVARLSKVPADTVEAYAQGRVRPHIEPDRSVAEAIEALFNRREPA